MQAKGAEAQQPFACKAGSYEAESLDWRGTFGLGKSLWGVASGCLGVAAGAQDPQCTWKYMRNPSTGKLNEGKIVSGRNEQRPVGGRRSGDTTTYKKVFEDVEHRLCGARTLA